MLALAEWHAGRCRRCGGDLAETTHPDHDGVAGNAGYRPQLPVRCHRCTALAKAEHDYRDAPQPQALIHQVELRPPRRKPPGT